MLSHMDLQRRRLKRQLVKLNEVEELDDSILEGMITNDFKTYR